MPLVKLPLPDAHAVVVRKALEALIAGPAAAAADASLRASGSERRMAERILEELDRLVRESW